MKPIELTGEVMEASITVDEFINLWARLIRAGEAERRAEFAAQESSELDSASEDHREKVAS